MSAREECVGTEGEELAGNDLAQSVPLDGTGLITRDPNRLQNKNSMVSHRVVICIFDG